MKKLIAVFAALFLAVGSTDFGSLTVQASANNITARANYLYNITWTAQKDVDGWKNRPANKYYANNSYRIPYGQPASFGKYIYWDISIEDFVKATKDANSDFYNKRSSYNGQESVYYAMDCSAFASYCWDLPYRNTTSSWASLPVTNLGICNQSNVYKIEPGDALCLAGTHIVIVTDVTYNGGQITSIEIAEETPKELQKVSFLPSDLTAKYSAYTIYRYKNRDSVAPPLQDEVQYDKTPHTQTSVVQNGASYDVNVEAYGIKSGVILVAGYKNGKMQRTKITHIGSEETLVFDGEIDMFRVMVWDSLNNLKPLCKAKTVTKNEW